MARGRISRFPIDLRRRPYNTVALPCECVITGHYNILSYHIISYIILTLQKKQLKQHIISFKTVADALKITVLNTKTSLAAWGFAPDTHYRLALPRSSWVCVWPPLFCTPRGPCRRQVPLGRVHLDTKCIEHLRRVLLLVFKISDYRIHIKSERALLMHRTTTQLLLDSRMNLFCTAKSSTILLCRTSNWDTRQYCIVIICQ